MVNFIDSFNKGISAAEKAIANKDEIDSVIKQLSDQLHKATEGKLLISIIEKQTPFNVLTGSITDVLSRKTYWALVASNPLSSFQPKELAQWKFAESGYPCSIILPDVEIYCEDKTALENALGRMLATPEAGKKLKTVIDQSPLK